jgi:hypothetical protein
MPVRVYAPDRRLNLGGFHKQPCLKEYAACSAALRLAWTSELGSQLQSKQERLNSRRELGISIFCR